MAKAKKPAAEAKPSREDVVAAICARLSKGEPLACICRDEAMPGLRTVYDWMEADEVIAAHIARAREEGEEAIAADCLSIADDSGEDYRMGEKSMLVDTDHIQRSKLRIWTRLELLKRWNPKKWGDKVQHGNDPENPLPAPVVTVTLVRPE